MTITPRSDFVVRQEIANEAQNLIHFQTALNVVPHTQENMDVCRNYRDGFNDACAHLKRLLVEYEPYGEAAAELLEAFDGTN